MPQITLADTQLSTLGGSPSTSNSLSYTNDPTVINLAPAITTGQLQNLATNRSLGGYFGIIIPDSFNCLVTNSTTASTTVNLFNNGVFANQGSTTITWGDNFSGNVISQITTQGHAWLRGLSIVTTSSSDNTAFPSALALLSPSFKFYDAFGSVANSTTINANSNVTTANFQENVYVADFTSAPLPLNSTMQLAMNVPASCKIQLCFYLMNNYKR